MPAIHATRGRQTGWLFDFGHCNQLAQYWSNIFDDQLVYLARERCKPICNGRGCGFRTWPYGTPYEYRYYLFIIGFLFVNKGRARGRYVI